MIGFHFAPNPSLALEYPAVYMGMGLTAENVAEQYDISREAQDRMGAALAPERAGGVWRRENSPTRLCR